MTKTFIRTTLAAVAALTLLPAIASAQSPNLPRKPAAQERQVTPRGDKFDHDRTDHAKASAKSHKRHGGRQQLADNRGDRRGDAARRPDGHDHDRRGDHGEGGDHDRRDRDGRGDRDGRRG